MEAKRKARDAEAATKIQSIARRRRGKKRVNDIRHARDAKTQAATKIQSQMRAKKARGRVGKVRAVKQRKIEVSANDLL